MEMPVPHSFYFQIPQEGIVRKSSGGCARDNKYAMQVQKCGHHSRGSVYRSCTFKRSNTAEDKYIEFYGISEGEKYTNDLR